MCAWASASQFLHHNSATIQFLDDMQMDACLKKEQIGTLFVWVGTGGRGGWGVGGPSGVSTPKSMVTVLFQLISYFKT